MKKLGYRELDGGGGEDEGDPISDKFGVQVNI